MSANTTRFTTPARFVHRWRQWQVARERELVHPFGLLALTSLDWLSDSPREYEGVPGRWWQDEHAAYLDSDGAFMAVDGVPVTDVRRFELTDGGPGARVASGYVEVEVARRTGYLVQVHDPSAPALSAFSGVPTYDPDPMWLLRGRFEPYERPRPVTVGAVVPGLRQVRTSPGRVWFEHAGREYPLVAFTGPTEDVLRILFTDATSGVTTCAASRVLTLDQVVAGEVSLDFNRAANPPCAFTDFTTCPLPPEDNRLPFAVTAGERLPYERQRVPPAPRSGS